MKLKYNLKIGEVLEPKESCPLICSIILVKINEVKFMGTPPWASSNPGDRSFKFYTGDWISEYFKIKG